MAIYQTYMGSLRPSGGVNEKDISQLCKWLKKKRYYTCCIEKKDENGADGKSAAHLHFVWVEEKPTIQSNTLKLLRDQLKHIVAEMRCINLQQDGHCLYVSCWYNLAGYCYSTKDEDILINNITEEDLELIIPSLWPAKDDKQNKRQISVWFHNLHQAWEKMCKNESVAPQPTIKNVKQFVMRQILDYNIEAIADKKVFNQKCDLLLRFILDDDTFEEEQPMGVCEDCKKRKHPGDFCN